MKTSGRTSGLEGEARRRAIRMLRDPPPLSLSLIEKTLVYEIEKDLLLCAELVTTSPEASTHKAPEI